LNDAVLVAAALVRDVALPAPRDAARSASAVMGSAAARSPSW